MQWMLLLILFEEAILSAIPQINLDLEITEFIFSN